jgi:tol-pal system protein YbgF
MSRPAALTLTLLLAGGCSTMPQLTSSAEVEARDRRILELEREIGRSRAEAASLRQRVSDLERELDRALERERAGETASAPLAGGGELATAGVGEESAIAPPPRLAVEESDLSDLVGPEVAGGEPGRNAEYESALTALRDGRVEEAERELERFASSATDSDLADNAWFWLGESRLARGDTAGAIDAYRTAIDRYPEGNKVPDALWKLGVALAASGDSSAAREVWNELVRRFPSSAVAEAARARLQEP